MEDIPSQELWEAHRRRKRYLVAFVRERVVAAAVARKASAAEQRRLAEVLDPDTFTIGFARRFATYKRATLLFRDIERLKRLLTNPERPVQIVIAGKAHPRDLPGKTLIREIVQLSRAPEIAKHIVFVEDYSIEVARELVQGVDLWLNTPRRGEEACGTSGMKAGINGVLNLSILDGWFDEGYEISGGWAIGDRETVLRRPGRNSRPRHLLHTGKRNCADVLSGPRGRRSRGLDAPGEAVPDAHQPPSSIASGWWASTWRNCTSLPIRPIWTSRATALIRPGTGRGGISEVEKVWDKIGFVEIGPGPDVSVLTGRPIPVRAVVNLAGSVAQGCAGGGRDWPDRGERESRGNPSDDASGGGAGRATLLCF